MTTTDTRTLDGCTRAVEAELQLAVLEAAAPALGDGFSTTTTETT